MFDKVLPFWIIKEYDNGVLLRFGRYVRTLGPGFYLKFPLVDEILTQHVVITTLSIPAQSISTKDNIQVVVKAVVKYRISDVKAFLLGVWDSTDAISDVTQSIVKKQIHIRTWEECNMEDLDNELTKKLRLEVKKWGVDISGVSITDIGIIRSIRLFNEYAPHEHSKETI